LHKSFGVDCNLDGIQNFHNNPVLRIGGIALIFALVGAFILYYFKDSDVANFCFLLLVSAIPAFLFGLLEDLTKRIGIKARLLAVFSSALLAGYLLESWLSSLQIFGIDNLILSYPWVSIFITCFAVAGVSNAFNIIDGFNGLSSMVGFIILGGIFYVSFRVGDFEIMIAALSLMGAILGFMVFNYPRGLIFLGDGGAYLIGFWIAELSILLTIRNSEVSKWFPLLLCAYPIFETLFTIYRRIIIRQSHPGMPDANHLHHMIYKRIVRWRISSKDSRDIIIRNSLTAPYLWILTSLTVIPAVIFWDNVWALRAFTLVFTGLYILIYRGLVLFKVPSWLIINKRL
jgi:UDP-N-acetylmuramyl pentapeptide phosphotransferase/UDP-N-acetylglucosamine-1-phosphate transferase